MNPAIERIFGFDVQKHNVRTEIMAGITTFLTMAYILAVNPTIFSALPGMPGGSVFTATALLAMIGLFITSGLVMAKVRGGILWGILLTTLIGLFIKDPSKGEAITTLNGVVSAPEGIAPIFCQFEWSQVLSPDMLVVVFTFLFIDMFDTMGTIIIMPLAYSISDGILIGVISYVLCHAVAGKFKSVSPTMWILAILFICKYIFI